jgi:hypothetical protein
MKGIDERWEIICNYKLLCKIDNKYIFYHAGKLFVGNQLEPPYKLLLKLVTGKKKIFTRVRLIERLFRLEPRFAIPLNSREFLLSYQGRILRIDMWGEVIEEHKYVDTMNNPLGFCIDNERILYGEYFGNLNHQEVKIFERDRSGVWNSIFSFPKGEVQHIHQIKYDQFRNCYWILTGDTDSESAIWKASCDFKKVEAIFRGKQTYRSCFIMPTEKGLYYATDTPLEENWIYFIEQQGEKILEPKQCFKMAGPCIYGMSLENNFYVMATSVEPDSSLPNYQYHFTKKLGAGVRERKTALVYGNPDTGFSEIALFKKDIHRMWLFQFGNILFPNVLDGNEILCTGQSLKEIDGKTIKVYV